MIGRLRGTLLSVEEGLLLVECAGVGYEVLAPERTALSLVVEEEVTLHIRHIVREDANLLYGFEQPFERRMFDRLVDVSGVGPKAALALLGTLEAEDLAFAIAGGDAKVLTRAPGIGLRTAERIVVDLKEKMAAAAMERKIGDRRRPAAKPEPTDELLDALVALGYRRGDVERVAELAREAVPGVPAQIRHALGLLKR